MGNKTIIIFIIVLVIAVALFFFLRGERFDLPRGETVMLSEMEPVDDESDAVEERAIVSDNQIMVSKSTRQVFVTDGVKHSIPLEEILSGGPPKDGIPSIDNPKFIGTDEADEFLGENDVGLGFIWKGEARFYPYQILVFHEIVNDTIGGNPILVTYCPLCATGVVFERRVNKEAQEFGVSGLLWQSNLLMYNRSADPDKESLWSQVLGEAVLGESTGERLKILRSDTVLYNGWKKKHPNTKVLSRDTGRIISYGRDPYGDYYTSDSVGFGASFNDARLHPKAFVLGIEVGGKFKAYNRETLKIGTTIDTFEDEAITVVKDDIGKIEMFIGENKQPLQYIGGFWFSWLAVHPETELYK